MTTKALSAAALLSGVGLMADGPVRWDRPVPASGPGLYVVEMAEPLPEAPIELTKVGKWLERVESLRIDGARPTSKALAARLASLWLPNATVLYIGSTTGSIGGRVRGLPIHVLGDRRPHADGHWLQTLRGLADLRVWWARTAAPEEALDAVLDAFAAVEPGAMPNRPAGALLLPWANMRRPTGERQQHGITASMIADEVVAPPPPTHVTEVAPGAADGASLEVKGSGTVRRTRRPASSADRTPARAASRATTPRATAPRAPRASASSRKREPVALSVEAIERMKTELDQLTRVRRPEVVARIKAARELGDLKENSDYHAAREEQSFLEGRVRLLEDRLRFAVVIDDTPDESMVGRVQLGSVVTVELDGEPTTFTLVGTTDAKPAAGRISTASPVGAALLGAAAGDEVEVRTPRGAVRYVVRSVS
jgi:transcription elongation factor GreA